MLSHLRSCERYDEPETLPSSICLFCPTSADGGQVAVSATEARASSPVALASSGPTEPTHATQLDVASPDTQGSEGCWVGFGTA
jgi:hypothetical protein